MPELFISIIIPCYNYAKFLPRAISSVTRQKLTNCEIIIIDDGSTDETESVVQALCEKNKEWKIHYVKQENSGAAAARNRGVDASQGQYVFFLDADDELVPRSVETVSEFLQKRPDVDALFGSHVSIFPDGKEKLSELSPFSEDNEINFKNYLFKRFSVVNGAMVVKREILLKLRFNEMLRVAEDIPIFALLLARFYCCSITTPLVKVFKHDDSLRHSSKCSGDANMAVVKEIFDSPLLPNSMRKYHKNYYARRCLSAFRTLYQGAQWAEARKYYCKALWVAPSSVFRFRLLKKFVYACFK
jgi:glycosyltransferase involved in cell wall biosynthesis